MCPLPSALPSLPLQFLFLIIHTSTKGNENSQPASQPAISHSPHQISAHVISMNSMSPPRRRGVAELCDTSALAGKRAASSYKPLAARRSPLPALDGESGGFGWSGTGNGSASASVRAKLIQTDRQTDSHQCARFVGRVRIRLWVVGK
ncbi:hypothetical protein BKA81DRAFT_374966 [Phyllosticta paracitricarpa]